MRLPRSVAVNAVIGFILLFIALLTYGVIEADTSKETQGAILQSEREEAPDKELPLLKSGEMRSLDYWSGKVIVVNFWASWCDSCRAEAPTLERIWKKNRKRGVVMVGFNTIDVRSDALEFIREFGLSYPMLRDKDGQRKLEWGLTGTPETFVVDRDGMIAWINRGPIEGPELQKVIDEVRMEN